MANIHPTAIIDPKAQLAEDVLVGAYAVIGPDVEIGSGCEIADHATIYGPTTIGADNQILQHVTLGGAPQDLHYKGEPTQLVIGDRNIIREYVSFSRGSVGGGGVTSFAFSSVLTGVDTSNVTVDQNRTWSLTDIVSPWTNEQKMIIV